MSITIDAETSEGLLFPLLALFFFAVLGTASSRLRPWVLVLRGSCAAALAPRWCCVVLSDWMGLEPCLQWWHCCGGKAGL